MLHTGNILTDTYVTIRGKDCVSVLVVMLEALVSHTYPLNAIYVAQDDGGEGEGEDDDEGEGEGEDGDMDEEPTVVSPKRKK